MNEPHDHHYVPQFFLRNFAVDPERKKLTTVAKHGRMAIWSERSIKQLGYERDLYVHLQAGVPISVETVIGDRIETPLSRSDTWAKIASERTDTLDRSDKPILYALIRHLEARTPHFRATALELATSDNRDIPFTDEEREMHAFIRSSPDRAKAFLNAMSASLEWTADNFARACISIFRSPIPLRSSTTPVLAQKTPANSTLHLPLPGMQPYAMILTLNKTTMVSLLLANFEDAFTNTEITAEQAQAFNRQFVAQFAFSEHVRHLITERHNLFADMIWAPYEVVEDTETKITFQRRDT